MSILIKLVRRLVVPFTPAPRADARIEMLTMRDWADLPPHHPKSDASSF